MRPVPIPRDGIVRRFTRGRARPRGVVWFGLRSFWGHIRHFIASAIATEDVDSRDWMAADEPRALAARVSRLLGGRNTGTTVTESLGRDVWIDFVADTGDDAAVSAAVARLLFAEYELPDPERPGADLRAPRGDILLFGGDTAYPVATADEITNRVLVPFNRVLSERDDGRRRVLLGIPGNHDWYDGLDGFGRLFRRRLDFDSEGTPRATLHGMSKTRIGQAANWAREFVRGGQVEKPDTLDLIGYVAVQGASYFALPLAPGLVMLGVDRQLKQIDFRQQRYFVNYLNQNVAVTPWLVLPDPVNAFGEPSQSGGGMVRALGLTLTARPHLVLSGDIHHYRREEEGATVHVTAGGGGAFLHPAPIARAGRKPAAAEWPSVEQCRRLLLQVPWKVALGRSGILPHIGFSLVYAPAAFAGADLAGAPVTVLTWALVTFVLSTLVFALIGGGIRKRRPLTLVLAFLSGTLVAALGIGTCEALAAARGPVPVEATLAVEIASVLVASTGATFVFGVYLSLLTLFGLENTQAFTALDHPGFKHFVRLRVRRDGSAVDGYCIGLVDPVHPEAQPVLVDAFSFRCR